jgi:hypothetical protein
MNLAPIAAQKLERTTESAIIRPSFRIVSTFDLAPFQAERFWRF